MSILLYGCTTWSLTKCLKKKLDGNYTKMLCAVLKKFWKQNSIKQLYGHLPPISLINQVGWARHTGYYTSVGQPTKPYIYQHCVDTGYHLERFPSVMTVRDGWWESKESILTARLDDDFFYGFVHIPCWFRNWDKKTILFRTPLSIFMIASFSDIIIKCKSPLSFSVLEVLSPN